MAWGPGSLVAWWPGSLVARGLVARGLVAWGGLMTSRKLSCSCSGVKGALHCRKACRVVMAWCRVVQGDLLKSTPPIQIFGPLPFMKSDTFSLDFCYVRHYKI